MKTPAAASKTRYSTVRGPQASSTVIEKKAAKATNRFHHPPSYRQILGMPKPPSPMRQAQLGFFLAAPRLFSVPGLSCGKPFQYLLARDERFFSPASHRAACSSNRARRRSSDERSSWEDPPSRNIGGRKRTASTSSTTNCAGLESVMKRASWPRPEPPGSRSRFSTTSISRPAQFVVEDVEAV